MSAQMLLILSDISIVSSKLASFSDFMNIDKGGEKICEFAYVSGYGLELVDLELNFLGFWDLRRY